jgi:uncharacterized Ntn-hydrolase superfamily protein
MDCTQDMVRDVVEIRCHFGADAGKVAANELSHQLGHSPERALVRVSSDLSSKIRATSSGSRKSCSDRRSIADVVLDHFEDGQILVDHSVQDRVQHIVDTLAELRRRCLELLPKFAQRSGIAVPHGDKVIVTGEDRHLAVADPVADQLAVWATTYNSSL